MYAHLCHCWTLYLGCGHVMMDPSMARRHCRGAGGFKLQDRPADGAGEGKHRIFWFLCRDQVVMDSDPPGAPLHTSVLLFCFPRELPRVSAD